MHHNLTRQPGRRRTAARSALLLAAGLTAAAGACAAGAVPPGGAELNWAAPTLNRDGSTLSDLVAFNVYHGTSPATLMLAATVPGTVSAYADSNLTPGIWYWYVTAINGQGRESAPSVTVSKTIDALVTPADPGTASAGSAGAAGGTSAPPVAGIPAGGTPDGTAGASDTGGATDSRPDNKVRFSRAHSQRNLCRPAGEVTCYGGR